MSDNALLRRLIREVILIEKAAWKRHGVELDSLAEIRPFVGKGCYVSFVDVNKLGVNPSYSYTKPFGIWAYPLDTQTFDAIENGTIPFGGDRNWIQVFRPKSPGSILDINDLSEEEYSVLKSEVIEMVHLDDVEVEKAEKRAGSNPGEKIFALTRAAGNGDPVRWSMVLRRLGFDGFLDKKRQVACFFSKDTVKHLGAALNPHRENKKSIK